MPEPTQEEIRSVLPDITCDTCNVTRNVLDFYDDAHTVNLVVSNDTFRVTVDHGETTLQRSRRDL